jgi:hypothetical protein
MTSPSSTSRTISIKAKFRAYWQAGDSPAQALAMTIAWLQCNTTTLPPDWQAELKDGDIALFSDGRELDPAQFQVDDVWEPGTLGPQRA